MARIEFKFDLLIICCELPESIYDNDHPIPCDRTKVVDTDDFWSPSEADDVIFSVNELYIRSLVMLLISHGKVILSSLNEHNRIPRRLCVEI